MRAHASVCDALRVTIRLGIALAASVLTLVACQGALLGAPQVSTDAGGPAQSDATATDSSAPDATPSMDSAMPSDLGFVDANSMDVAPTDVPVVPTDFGTDLGVDASIDAATPVDATMTVDAGSCAACATYASAASLGNTDGSILTEASGIAASRAHTGFFYTHNDEGLRVYALNSSAAIVATIILDAESACGGGATRCDAEDISVGPCGDGTSCIYLGNIGVNGSDEPSTHAVYRAREPSTLSGTSTVSFDKLAYVFPDGNHNSEAMAVHPITGEIYIITKRTDDASQPSQVYRFPMPTVSLVGGTMYTLVHVTSDLSRFAGELITSADIQSCGTRMLIRTYGHVYELTQSGASFESIFSATSGSTRTLPVASDSGGEAVGYAADGASYYTITEHLAATTPLYQYLCSAP